MSDGNLWERAKEALADLRVASKGAYQAGRIPAEPYVRAGNILAEMQRVECVEGKADPSGGFWTNKNFPSDRIALLLLPEEPK